MKEWRERDRLKGHVDQTHLLVQLLHTHEVQGLDPVEWQRERERKRERESYRLPAGSWSRLNSSQFRICLLRVSSGSDEVEAHVHTRVVEVDEVSLDLQLLRDVLLKLLVQIADHRRD